MKRCCLSLLLLAAVLLAVDARAPLREFIVRPRSHAARMRVASACTAQDEMEFLPVMEGEWTSTARPVALYRVIAEKEMEQEILDMGFEIVSTRDGRPLRLDPPSGYHTPEELYDSFIALQSNFSGVAHVLDVTTTYKQQAGHEGGHIYAIKLSDNVDEDEDEPNYLIVSNHHARELITPELALAIATRLLDEYEAGNAETRSLLDNHQVYILWTMNPDGLAYVWSTDDYWRKNRRANPNGSYGVDLNRNYPVGWDFSCGGSTSPISETYRGPSAASEPEVQTMLAFQLDRSFSKVLDFHSYAREVRINYGDCASLPTTVDDYFKDVAGQLADRIDYLQARSCCMGGNIHVAYHDAASLAFLVETGTAFQPPAEAMRAEIERVYPGARDFLLMPESVSGHVLDRSTRRPVAAHLVIQGLAFNLEERILSDARNGRYHLWLPNGSYNVTVSATGYQPVTVTLRADNAQGTVEDVLLG